MSEKLQNETYQPTYMHTQQPGAIPVMNVNNGGGNRNARNKPFNQAGEREWSNGLCDYFGACGTCCLGAWCPCILFSKNKSRLQHLERDGTPEPHGGEGVGADCMIYCCLTSLTGFGWVLQISPRAQIRRRYRIAGGNVGDIFVSWCCVPCALTQESREIELEEHSLRG